MSGTNTRRTLGDIPVPAPEGSSSHPSERLSLLQAAQSLRHMYQDLRHVHDTLLQRLEQNNPSSLSADDLQSLRPDYDALLLAGADDSGTEPSDPVGADALDQAMARLLMYESRVVAVAGRTPQRRRMPALPPPVASPTRRLPSRHTEDDDFATTSIGRAVSQRETIPMLPPIPSSQSTSSEAGFQEEGLTPRLMRQNLTPAERSLARVSSPSGTSNDSMPAMAARRLARLREQRRLAAQSASSPHSADRSRALSTLSNFSMQNLTSPSILPPNRSLLFEEPESMTANENDSLEALVQSQASFPSPGMTQGSRYGSLAEQETPDLTSTRRRIQQTVSDLYRSRQNVSRTREHMWTTMDPPGLSAQYEGFGSVQPEQRLASNPQAIADRIRRQMDALGQSARPLGSPDANGGAPPRVRLNRSFRSAEIPVFDPDAEDLELPKADNDNIEVTVEVFGSAEPYYPSPLPVALSGKFTKERKSKGSSLPTEVVYVPRSASMAGR